MALGTGSVLSGFAEAGVLAIMAEVATTLVNLAHRHGGGSLFRSSRQFIALLVPSLSSWPFYVLLSSRHHDTHPDSRYRLAQGRHYLGWGDARGLAASRLYQ